MVIQRNWKPPSENNNPLQQATSSSDDSNGSNQTNSSSNTTSSKGQSSKFITTPQMAENVLARLKQRFCTQITGQKSSSEAVMRSFELLRINVQAAFDKEIDAVIKKFMENYFKPAFKNIKENLGENVVSDDVLQKMSCALLENSKSQYNTRAKTNSNQSNSPVRTLSTAGQSFVEINSNLKHQDTPIIISNATPVNISTIGSLKRPFSVLSASPISAIGASNTLDSPLTIKRPMMIISSYQQQHFQQIQQLQQSQQQTVQQSHEVQQLQQQQHIQQSQQLRQQSQQRIQQSSQQRQQLQQVIHIPEQQQQPSQQLQQQQSLQTHQQQSRPSQARRQIFWNTANISTETRFCLDVQANQAFGFGTDGRERLASKHPELIRYLPDGQDRDWLVQQRTIPAQNRNSRFLFLVYDEVIKLGNSDLYRNKENLNLSILHAFKVPSFVIQKMKAFFIDLNIKSRGLITNSFTASYSGSSHLRNALLQGSQSCNIIGGNLPNTTNTGNNMNTSSTSSSNVNISSGSTPSITSIATVSSTSDGTQTSPLAPKPKSSLSSSHATLTALLTGNTSTSSGNTSINNNNNSANNNVAVSRTTIDAGTNNVDLSAQKQSTEAGTSTC